MTNNNVTSQSNSSPDDENVELNEIISRLTYSTKFLTKHRDHIDLDSLENEPWVIVSLAYQHYDKQGKAPGKYMPDILKRYYKEKNYSEDQVKLTNEYWARLKKRKTHSKKNEKYLSERVIQVAMNLGVRRIMEEMLPGFTHGDISKQDLDEYIDKLETVPRLSDGSQPKIHFKYGNEIDPEPVEWLWPRWLPRGMVVLLDGDPGNAKSLITVKMAARLTRGKNNDPVKVMFFAAEDDAAAVIIPRLLEVGADMSRVMIEAFNDEEDEERRKETRDTFFQLKDAGLKMLEDFLQAERPSLVVIDPLFSYLGGGKDALDPVVISAIVRRLTRLARKYDCTFLLIRHLTKDTKGKSIYLGQGPMAIIGGARHALFAGRDPKDPNKRALAVNKSNVGPEGITLGFKIVPKKRKFKGKETEVVKVFWTGKTDLTVTKMTGSEKGESKLETAMRFYQIQLAGGRVRVQKAKEAGLLEGISDETQRRARKKLGIVIDRESKFQGRGYYVFKK